MIAEEILSSAKGELEDRIATDVRIGLGYAGVKLDDGSVGMAYCFLNKLEGCCEFVKEAGDLEGNAWDLAKHLGNSDIVKSSIGLATVNAVLNNNVEGKEGDLLEFLDIRKDDKVGMVGYFEPMVKRMSDDIDLMIFDDQCEGFKIFPAFTAEYKLPKADVAIVTATSIINNTIDELLKLCSDARTVAILGPSTPLTRELKRYGAHLLAGMMVKDPEKCMKIISQGGGAQCLHRACNKVTLDLRA
jgi:hypothetical protein